MSDCRNFETDLSALIDGELPGDRQAEVIEHVDQCPACAQRVAELQKLTTGIAALPQAQPPPLFLADVRRKLEPTPTWVDILFRPVWWKLPMGALAVLAVVVGVSSFLRPAPTPTPVVVAQPASGVTARILSDERAKAAGPAAERKEIAVSPELTAGVVTQPVVGEMVAARPELPETMIVRGDSLVAVRLRVENLAKDLDGRVEPVTPSNTFLVYLPKSKVETFRRHVAGGAKGLSFATEKPPAPAQPDPVVGVEVVVQP